MSQTTDVLNVQVNVNGDTQYRERMQRCTGSTLAFKAAVAGITLATKKFIRSALELASNLTEVQNVVDTTFGGMADAVNQFSKAAIQNYGLSETIAKKYTGMYGAMARQFGFTTEEALKMSTTLTGMTGDAASFYNYEPDQVYTKLKSVFTGETESLKEIGVTMTQAALDQYALEKGMGKTTKQMSEQEKVALRYMFVMEQMERVNGDYKNTSHEWANSVRTAKLEIESMIAEIGANLMPAAKVALGYTMQGLRVVLGYLKNAAHGISLVAEGFRASSTSTKIFVGLATGAVFALLNFNKIAALTSTAVGFMSSAMKILNMDLMATLTLTQALKGALGIIALIGGIVGAVKLMSSLSSIFDKVESSMKSQTGTVSDLSNEWKDGSESVKDYTDSTKELERALMSFDEVNKIGEKSILGDIIDKDSLEDFGNFKDMLDGLYDNVELGDILNGASDSVADLTSKFGSLMDKINKVKEIWAEPIEGETFGEKTLDVFDKLNESMRLFIPDWVDLWEQVGMKALDEWDKLKQDWSKAWDAIKDIGSTAWKVVNDLISGDIVQLGFDLAALIAKIKMARDAWLSRFEIKQGVSEDSIFYNPNSSNNKLANTIVTSSKSLSSGSNGSSWYRGSTNNNFIGPVKPYAAGGFPDMGEMFVARESGPEMVGRIGNKTAVANNDQITTAIYNAVKSALGTGNSRGGTTVLYVDGKVLGKATVDYINNQTMSSGQSPLVEIG